MKEQSYQNHVRFHPFFHFFLFPLTFALFVASVFNLFPAFRGGMELWFAVVLMLGSLALVFTVLLARTYANKVQNRVVRVEENFRHYRLVGQPLDPGLTMAQIIALRFASDDEFPALCARALQERLSADEIKKAVTAWRADQVRV